MWQRREKDVKRSRISRVVQDSLLDGLLLVGDGTQAGELFQMVTAPCLDSPAVVMCYTTHFTPASASPSAGHMKRTFKRKAAIGLRFGACCDHDPATRMCYCETGAKCVSAELV